MIEYKTLTAQAYCLQCTGAGSATCSYGSATEGSPLIFNASAGGALFETIGIVDSWMLTAGPYVHKIIPPGQSVVSTVGTVGGNGLSVPLTGSNAADRLLAGLQGTGSVACLVKMGASAAEIPNSTILNMLSAKDAPSELLFASIGAASEDNIANSSDGTATASVAATTWNRKEFHYRVIESNGTKFRVGVKRYSSAMVPIDTNIVWSHATLAGGANFDGSFNPTTFLRFFLNNTVPNNLKLAWTSNQHSLGETEIERRRTTYA